MQIVAESVALLCPYCGEAFPSENGSEFWTVEELSGLEQGTKECPSCEQDVTVVLCNKAILQVQQ